MTQSDRKIAIVTGGSRGIGRSTVLSLATQGVDSIFTYHSNLEEAEKVILAVKEMGRNAIALKLDTGNVSTFDTFVQEVNNALKQLDADRFDYLVNNAGISLRSSFETTTEEQLDRVYNVHFKGVFFLSQKLLPLIQDGGRIINISSGLTRLTIPHYGAYAAMKAAVETLTRYMAKELGARKIAVNTIAPGSTASDFGGGALRDNAEVNQYVATLTALGGVGQPEDIADAITALLSSNNRWITAQRIEVSGGESL